MNSKEWYEIAKNKAAKFLDGETRIYSDDIIITSRMNCDESGKQQKTYDMFYIERVGVADNSAIIHDVRSGKTFDIPFNVSESEDCFIRNLQIFHKKEFGKVDDELSFVFGGLSDETFGMFRENSRIDLITETELNSNGQVRETLSQLANDQIVELSGLQSVLTALNNCDNMDLTY